MYLSPTFLVNIDMQLVACSILKHTAYNANPTLARWEALQLVERVINGLLCFADSTWGSDLSTEGAELDTFVFGKTLVFFTALHLHPFVLCN